MKIIHTSDWHLGKSIYGKSMLEDQSFFIKNNLLKILKREKPNVMIISGDVFDKLIAPIGAIKLFDETLDKIRNLNIIILIVTGNHDSNERISLYSSILRKENIYIVSDTQAITIPITIIEKNQQVDIYMLPFMDSGLENFVKLISKQLNKGSFNMIVSHCFVSGCKLNEENKISVGSSEEVSPDIFGSFDYVALGHLHSKQHSKSNIFYSGSPLSYTFNENEEKYILLVEINDGIKSIKNIPIKPYRKMKTLNGTFKEIIEFGKKSPSDDYTMIELSDNAPVYMPMAQLRVYFPNLLILKSDWINLQIEHNREQSELMFEEVSDEQIFKQFMERVCNLTPLEQDLKIFRESIKEVLKNKHLEEK